MDCTLRDGANVIGNGFPGGLTELILKGLTENGISIIEFGNAKGIGAYEVSGAVAPLTDKEYLEMAQPFLGRAEIGMFLNAKRFRKEHVKRAADGGLAFLRIGADAGDWELSAPVIESVKEHGLKAYYALMKAYLLTPGELAAEAEKLESLGADEVTIMDSAGTMRPGAVKEYTEALKRAVRIPVGFHGHNNLGFSAANAVSAAEGGADLIDCGLLGMARSAGNIPTELAAAVLEKETKGIDFFGLLDFLEHDLIPEMEKYGYHAPIEPLDLVLGYAGCHSSFVESFKRTAAETKTDLFRLICEASKENQKNPDKDLIRRIAKKIKNRG